MLSPLLQSGQEHPPTLYNNVEDLHLRYILQVIHLCILCNTCETHHAETLQGSMMRNRMGGRGEVVIIHHLKRLLLLMKRRWWPEDLLLGRRWRFIEVWYVSLDFTLIIPNLKHTEKNSENYDNINNKIITGITDTCSMKILTPDYLLYDLGSILSRR